ncbi:M4 family metallopeptidase [Actinosynnema sp. NPDC020468]|uniref:M4 family metallopeptidase n=1 Tax=Actinosynnema sp. NPDC020468 TaxID=3154488 RepID=UPI0033EFCE9A
MRSTHRLTALGGAVAAGMVVIGTAVATPTPTAPVPPAVSAAQAQANATSGAAALVANPPAGLFASAKDKFVQRTVRSAGGLQYVVYDRTYQDLPVVGGDFVVATDDSGAVRATSVAQTRALGDVDVRAAKLDQGQADAVALRQLTGAKVVSAGRKVVVADGAGRLAYESNVEGKDSDGEFSSLSVYVDALDGRVLSTVQHVAAGTGTGKWNGPAPLPLDTVKSGSTYYLRDPGISALECRDYATDTVLTGTDDTWGNGSGTNKETGCVDALYVAQTENKMLSQWLGRNSFNGNGGAWKINVGLDDQNAYYYNSRPAYVYIGHNPSGEWVASLDILGHEMGHGIDDYSGSGGFSGGGTQEFIADTFGTATEWFANESSQYDPPDYEIGERSNLLGTGPIRYMYQPSKHNNDPNCYSSSIPNAEVHAAAGPGDHWFYLLAEGSNPTNGQPTSPTCNNSTITGLGLQKAIKIMHGAVQLKTSGSNYLKYRTWSLQAAKNLYPNSCAEFNTVKAAWDAVSVPAQSGDPTCTGGPTTTTSPTTTTTPPTTTTKPTTTTPPTTTTQPGGCSGQKLANTGFESGRTSWSDPNTAIGQFGAQAPARSGTWDAWLGGWGSAHTDTISQSVAIPAGCRATLSFWLRIDTAEVDPAVYDKLVVSVGGTAVGTYTNLDKTSGYVQKTIDVSSYAGQTVTVKFAGTEDQSLKTSFLVDDTALTLG